MAELQRFVEGRLLIGRFIQIDLKALRKELGEQQHELSNPALDTARVHRWIQQNGRWREDLAQQLEKVSLEALPKVYDLDFHEAHHALDDALVTARLWQKLIAKLEAMSIANLGDLLRIAKA